LRRRPPEALPLTLLTGFLGAGKTTLLNRLVQAPELARAVVIINEFGDVPIDHLLVEKADEAMLTLSSGCLCCSVRGDLVATLEDLLRRRDNGRIAPFDRVVIETTGLADPAPILNTVALHPYLMLRFAIEGVITVVDAVHGAATLDRFGEAVRQVAMADCVVLSKTDLLAEPGAAAALRDRLATLNPLAEIVEAGTPAASAGALLAASLFRNAARLGEAGSHGHEQHAHEHGPEAHDRDHDHGPHDAGVGSLVLTAEKPLAPASADMLLDLLRATHGAKLLRVKGLLALSDDPARPLLIQAVQHTAHPARRLAAWPDGDTTSRLVVIGLDLDDMAIRRLWAAFTAPPAVDQPDAAALASSLDRGGPGLF
jgi:G3E family GTPase